MLLFSASVWRPWWSRSGTWCCLTRRWTTRTCSTTAGAVSSSRLPRGRSTRTNSSRTTLSSTKHRPTSKFLNPRWPTSSTLCSTVTTARVCLAMHFVDFLEACVQLWPVRFLLWRFPSSTWRIYMYPCPKNPKAKREIDELGGDLGAIRLETGSSLEKISLDR